MNDRLVTCIHVLAGVLLAVRLDAQSCYTRVSPGGNSTVTLVSAVEGVGTSPSNMNARENDGRDASYYQLSTFSGPASVTVATALVSGSIADNDHAPFGLTFINGTSNAVTVTQVDVTSDRNHIGLFRMSPKPTTIDPAAGAWTMIDNYTARWTGSIVVPAKSGQGFIADISVSNVRQSITNVVVGGTITTSIGAFVANGFPTDLFVPDRSNKVATAVVGFVDSGLFPRTLANATNGPPANLIGGQPSLINVRVREFANNEAIASGLTLTLTLPAQWSSVSVVSAPAPWNAASATVTGSSAAGWTISIRTTATINKGTSSPDVQIRATPPVVYTKSTFLMKASLAGADTSAGTQGAHPIRSVCDGGGTILPSGASAGQTLNVEFLSPQLNGSTASAPVESLDFRTDFDIANSAGAVQVTVAAYNFSTSAWTTLATTSLAPGNPEYTLAQSFTGGQLVDYLDARSRMRVRYVTNTSAPQTLRIDLLGWNAQVYWVVDSESGDDAPVSAKFPGSAVTPFRTLIKAMTVVGPSERVQVNGRSTPYAGNAVIPSSAAGTNTCKTLLQGVTIFGQTAKIHGTNPSTDFAVEIAANDASVDNFTIDNENVALAVDPSVQRSIVSNNAVSLPAFGYGVLLNASMSATVLNNIIAGYANASSGQTPFNGIYDYTTQSTTIDGNRINGIPAAEGIMIWGSGGVTIQRNIVTNTTTGIYLAATTGSVHVYNNTVDSNSNAGMYAQGNNGITSRNNIVIRNFYGWRASIAGTVNSDFDDVSNNSWRDYDNVTAKLPPAGSSLNVLPGFVQTTTPSLSTFYQLVSGDPCVNAGTSSTGLPYNGSAPDIGAVEN